MALGFPLITLCALIIDYRRINGKIGIVGLLIVAYLVSGVASVLLQLSPLDGSALSIDFEPMVYLSACFVVIYLGFRRYRDDKFVVLRIENTYLFRILEYFLIVGGFLSIFFFAPMARQAFSGDILSNRLSLATTQNVLQTYGPINSIFSLISNSFILAQVCFFINLIPRNGQRNVRKAGLLLVSSFSYIFYIFAYVGRDGVIYWSMTFAFCYLLFSKYFLKKDSRLIKYVFAIVIIFLTVPFLLISNARFSADTGGTGWQIVKYAGTFGNFNDYYLIDPPLQYGRSEFPVASNYLLAIGVDLPGLNKEEQYSFILNRGVQPWKFATFIGHSLFDFGKLGTLFFVCLISLSIKTLLDHVMKSRTFEFSNLLLFVLLYQIVFWGVFYFRQYSTNYYILLIFMLSIAFRVLKKDRFEYFRVIKNKEISRVSS